MDATQSERAMDATNGGASRKRPGLWCSLFDPESAAFSIVNFCKGSNNPENGSAAASKRSRTVGSEQTPASEDPPPLDAGFQLEKDEIQSVLASWFGATDMVEAMVRCTLQTIKKGGPEMWENLAGLVTAVQEVAFATLDEPKVVGVAFVFQSWAAQEAGKGQLGGPPARVLQAMVALGEPLQRLMAREEYEELRKGIATDITEAGLFLRVLVEGKPSQTEPVLLKPPAQRALLQYEALLYGHMQTAYVNGTMEMADLRGKPRAEGKPVQLPVWELPGSFLGRSAELNEVAVLLNPGEGFKGEERNEEGQLESGRPKVLGLIGDEGMGKTQMALQYACQLAGSYDGVFWLDAGSTELPAHVAAFDSLLGVHTAYGMSIGERMERVMEKMERKKRFLVILDDAASDAALVDILPQSGAAHVIVTSSAPLESVALQTELKGMSMEDALEVLQEGYLHEGAEAQLLKEVAQELELRPLALGLAGRLLAQLGLLPSDLLRLLRQDLTNGAQLGSPGTEARFRSPSSLRALFDEAMEVLADGSEDGALARGMLEVCGWFGAQPVPVPLLTMAVRRMRGQDPTEVDEPDRAIGRILKLQLAHQERSSRGLIFHSLVREYSRSRDFGGAAAVAVLKTGASARCCPTTVGHLALLWARRQELVDTHPIVLKKVLEVGRSLVYYGLEHWPANQVAEICDQVLGMGESMGDIRLHFWYARAVLMSRGGDKRGAALEGRRCLEEMEESLASGALGLCVWGGILTDEVAAGMKSLADAVDECDLFEEEAMELAVRVKPRDLTGPYGDLRPIDCSDSLVILAMQAIGRVYAQIEALGDQARTHEAVVLKLLEKVMPRTDPKLLEAYWGMSRLYAKLDETCLRQQVVIDTFRESSGWESMESSDQGSIADRRLRSDQGPRSVESAQSLGDLHFDERSREEAKRVLANGMSSLLQIDGPMTLQLSLHCAIYGGMSTLISRPQDLALISVSIRRLEEILAVNRREGLESSEAYWEGTRQLARLHEVAGQLAEAQETYGECIALEQGRGPRMPPSGAGAYLGSTVELACVMMKRGLFHETETVLAACLEGRDGQEELSLAQAAQLVALQAAICWRRGEADAAKSLLEKGRALLEGLQGVYPFRLADILDALGHVQKQQGNHIQAFNQWQRALGLREEVLGPSHPSLAFGLLDMAGIEAGLGRRHAARELRDRALQVLEGTQGPDLLALRNLADRILSDENLQMDKSYAEFHADTETEAETEMDTRTEVVIEA